MKAGLRLPTSSNGGRPRAAARGRRPGLRAGCAGALRCRGGRAGASLSGGDSPERRRPGRPWLRRACPAPSASRRERRRRAAQKRAVAPQPRPGRGPHEPRPPPRRGRHASAARRRGRPSRRRRRASSRAGAPRRARLRRSPATSSRSAIARTVTGGMKRVAGGVGPHERAVGKRSTRERDDLRRRLARAGVVVGEQRRAAASRPKVPAGGSVADALEQLGGVAVEARARTGRS